MPGQNPETTSKQKLSKLLLKSILNNYVQISPENISPENVEKLICYGLHSRVAARKKHFTEGVNDRGKGLEAARGRVEAVPMAVHA